MIKFQISIKIKAGLNFPYRAFWLKAIVAKVLQEENINNPLEMGLVITDDSEIQELNRLYRGIDSATDVLSFAWKDNTRTNKSSSFVSSPENKVQLGEIIISYPQTLVQADKYHKTPEQELILLIVHGTLHLLSYDHEKITSARKMEEREKIIIRKINQELESV